MGTSLCTYLSPQEVRCAPQVLIRPISLSNAAPPPDRKVHAADGYTTERYMRAPAARDEGEAQRSVGARRPDIGTCLIGVRRHCKKATVAAHAGTDWFHHIRLSVLQHLWQTRNECWVKDHHSTEMDICKRVAKDIVSRLLVESATGKAPMAAALVLRPGATFKTARPRDFQDLSLW